MQSGTFPAGLSTSFFATTIEVRRLSDGTDLVSMLPSENSPQTTSRTLVMSCKTADARGKIKDGAIKPPTGVRTDVRGGFGGGVCAGGCPCGCH